MEKARRSYILVVGKTPQALENKVGEKIKEGYAPWGGFGMNEYRLVQPMIWRKGLDG